MKSVLYFSTEWCGPCRLFYPTVQEVCNATGTILQKIDAEKSGDLAQQYSITGVPTLIVVENGKAIYRNTGVMPKSQLISLLS